MIGLALRRRAGLAAGAIALTAVSGCSLAFVDAPPRDHASRHFFDCTTSMLAPGTGCDGLAGIMALGVVGAMSDGTRDVDVGRRWSGCWPAGALASATYGYLQVPAAARPRRRWRRGCSTCPTWAFRRPDLLGAPDRRAARLDARAAADRGDEPPSALAARDPWLSEGPPPPATAASRTDVDATSATLSPPGPAGAGRRCPRHRRNAAAAHRRLARGRASARGNAAAEGRAAVKMPQPTMQVHSHEAGSRHSCPDRALDAGWPAWRGCRAGPVLVVARRRRAADAGGASRQRARRVRADHRARARAVRREPGPSRPLSRHRL